MHPVHLIKLQTAKPFRPYTIVLSTGEAISVLRHEDFVLLPEDVETICMKTGNGEVRLIDTKHIMMIRQTS